MKRFLVRVAITVLKKFGHRILSIPPEVIDVAVELLPHILDQEDKHAKETGEYRRHQVYARGLKLYPEMDKVDLALAVELGVRRMKGR